MVKKRLRPKPKSEMPAIVANVVSSLIDCEADAERDRFEIERVTQDAGVQTKALETLASWRGIRR